MVFFNVGLVSSFSFLEHLGIFNEDFTSFNTNGGGRGDYCLRMYLPKIVSDQKLGFKVDLTLKLVIKSLILST